MGSGGTPSPLPPGRQNRAFSSWTPVPRRGTRAVAHPVGWRAGRLASKTCFLSVDACALSVDPGFHRDKGSVRPCAWARSEAYRAISTGQLHVLPRFHTQPIDVVVFHGSQGIPCFEGGFPLRCLQRLSRPYLATLLCHWRDNRSTRDMSTPVLSY